MKSILLINRVFPPASGATGQLMDDLSACLVEHGWNVTVLTGPTCHEPPVTEGRVGVRVERVAGLPFTRSSHWKRLISYLSLYPQLLCKAIRLPAHDVIVTMTDPPMQSVLGPILQKLKGGYLIHWAQDIYPELAEELNVLPRRGWIARVLRFLSNASLRRHDHIVAVGECMKERLIERGLSAKSISVIPNWGHAPEPGNLFQNGQTFRRRYGLKNRFVVMYSGNLGMAHPMEAILESARTLNENFPEIVFVMVGDGPKMALLKSRVEEAGLNNVRFLPPRQRGQLAECLAAADVHLACMHTHLLGLVVPSKVYGVLAAGRPCLFLGPSQSEVARLIRGHRCGAVLDPDDSKGLADQLVHWFANREQWQAAIDRAQQAVDQVTFQASWCKIQKLLSRVSLPENILPFEPDEGTFIHGDLHPIEGEVSHQASSPHR